MPLINIDIISLPLSRSKSALMMPADSPPHVVEVLAARSHNYEHAAQELLTTKLACIIGFFVAFILCFIHHLICILWFKIPYDEHMRTSKNPLVLLIMFPSRAYRFFQKVKKQCNAKKTENNLDVEGGVENVGTGSSTISDLRASRGVVGLGIYDRLAPPSQPSIPGPANGFTPQLVHAQDSLRHSDTEPSVRASDHPCKLTYKAPSSPIVRSSGRSLLTSGPGSKPILHVSPRSPVQPHSAYFSDGRNVVGGENSEYFNTEAQWLRQMDPASIPLPVSPKSDRRKSFESDSFDSVFL